VKVSLQAAQAFQTLLAERDGAGPAQGTQDTCGKKFLLTLPIWLDRTIMARIITPSYPS
jgi:hypothetical protein